MPRKRQGLRSYHHKSRNGCSNCKRRRVKCNLQAPACANCVRRNEICEYQSLVQDAQYQWSTATLVRGTNPLELGTKRVGESLEHVPGVSSSVQPMRTQLSRRMSLTSGALESYMTHPDPFSSSLSLAMQGSFFNDSERALWMPAIKKAGEQYAYVQHAFLSVSSLLIEVNTRAQNLPVAAYQHHLASSNLFQMDTPNIMEENWIAVISFGVMTVIFEFAIQQICPASDFDMLHSLLVFRNFMTIDNAVGPYLHKTKMWPLIQKRNSTFTPPLDHQLQTSFRNMATLIAHMLATGTSNAEINRQAFWELREWSYGCSDYPRNWRHYCEWPTAVSDEFIHILSEEDEVAILIAIHWCAVLYKSPKRWYITRWAQRAALHLISKLKGGWPEYLVWPLSVLLDNSIMPAFPTLGSSLPDSHLQLMNRPVDPRLDPTFR